jgi:hypothetical protein
VKARALAAAALLTAAPAARALDPFEIQVYDGTANKRGEPGVELHLNVSASAFHATLEPSYGVTDWLELGAYLQSALQDGSYQFAGVKARCKVVTPPGWQPPLRLGVNVELSWLPAKFDPSQWGAELRPIIAWEDARWLLAFNPIVDFSFALPGSAEGPSFEPAAMAKVKLFGGKLAAGPEYYAALATFGGGVPALREQQHVLFAAVDLLAVEGLELNVALGHGLTSTSPGLVGKAIVGFSFGK